MLKKTILFQFKLTMTILMVCLTDRPSVKHSKDFVSSQCLHNESVDRQQENITDATHKLQGSVSTPPSPPDLFSWMGVTVNTWQTPKSQRCRKLLCEGEHVIHLFSHTCLSFESTMSLTLCLFALFHFQCQHKVLFLYYSNKVRCCGLVRPTQRGIWFIPIHGAP